MPSDDTITTAPITITELQELINPDDVPEIYELLLDHPRLYPHFIHFSAIKRTLRRLEHVVQATKEELEMSFNDMKNNDLDDTFSFLIARKRSERRQQQSSPYQRPLPSTSSQTLPTEPPPTYSSPTPTRRPIRQATPYPRQSTPVQRTISPGAHFSALEIWTQYERPCTRCDAEDHCRTDCTTPACSNCGELNHDIQACPRQGEYLLLPDGRYVTIGRQPILDDNGDPYVDENHEENARMWRRINARQQEENNRARRGNGRGSRQVGRRRRTHPQ